MSPDGEGSDHLSMETCCGKEIEAVTTNNGAEVTHLASCRGEATGSEGTDSWEDSKVEEQGRARDWRRRKCTCYDRKESQREQKLAPLHNFYMEMSAQFSLAGICCMKMNLSSCWHSCSKFLRKFWCLRPFAMADLPKLHQHARLSLNMDMDVMESARPRSAAQWQIERFLLCIN